MYDERTHRYRYDNQHRLVHYIRTQYDKTQAEGRYVYDPLGRRVGKQVWKREREHPDHEQMALSRRPYTTWYGWEGDRLATVRTQKTKIQTIYGPGSFTPLLRIETDSAELDKAEHRTLADVLQQGGSEDGGDVVFPAELVRILDRLEGEIRRNQITEESREWLAGCGLTVEQMAAQMEKEYTPERTIHLYHCDHRGLPLALISPDNGIAWRGEYDEWGNLLREESPQEPQLQQLIRLPGQQYDEESGLYYNRHRYYNPELGRYITQDPIGLKGGWNLYSYAFSNPIKFIDPRGLDIWLEGPAEYEPDLHMSVNVGNIMDYSSYSFGSAFLLYGEVYRDTSKNGVIYAYKKTTPEEDAAFKEKMESMVGDWGIYGITDICRSWSMRQFANAPGKLTTRPDQILPSRGYPNVLVTSSQGSSSTGTWTSK